MHTETLLQTQNISWEFGPHSNNTSWCKRKTPTLADFLTSAKLGKMRLQITSDGTARTIVWAYSWRWIHLKLMQVGPVLYSR